MLSAMSMASPARSGDCCSRSAMFQPRASNTIEFRQEAVLSSRFSVLSSLVDAVFSLRWREVGFTGVLSRSSIVVVPGPDADWAGRRLGREVKACDDDKSERQRQCDESVT